MDKMKRLFNMFLDELYADKFVCLCCKDERLHSNHGYLCDKCFEKLHFIEHACEKCGDEVGPFDKYCDTCKSKDFTHTFDKSYCVAKYVDTAKTIVYELKYGKDQALAKVISGYLVEKAKTLDIPLDMVIPVPLGPKKFRTRGFNQSELLAYDVAQSLNLPLETKLVLRTTETMTQTSMSRRERLENVKGAFSVVNKDDVKGKNILLVDDIVTTGSTADDISRMLKKKGANKVYVLAFCHA